MIEGPDSGVVMMRGGGRRKGRGGEEGETDSKVSEAFGLGTVLACLGMGVGHACSLVAATAEEGWRDRTQSSQLRVARLPDASYPNLI